jgi:hypothetical protein
MIKFGYENVNENDGEKKQEKDNNVSAALRIFNQ